MYICDYCDEVFEEPVEYKEDMNGEGAYQTFSVSPCCKASYTELKECEACEVNYVPEHDEYCEECIKDVDKAMQGVTEELIGQGMKLEAIKELIERWINV